MMEWTDRHCRFFHRLMTRRALLYTEMVTTGAVLRGDRAALIGFDPFEHPVALQLGGSDPRALAQCARIAQDPEEALETFAGALERARVDALVVHARKAWLKGLSPRQNRDVPPLDYDRVYRLKRA